MKTLKTLLVLILLSNNNSFSQSLETDIKIEFQSTFADSLAGTSFKDTVKLTNNGGIRILSSRVALEFWYTVNGVVYSFNGKKNRKTIKVMPHSLSPNISMLFYPNFNTDSIKNAARINNICFHAKLITSYYTDTNSTNNYDCYIFKDTNVSSINENELERNFKITTSFSNVNIDSKLNKHYQYNLLSINGILIKTGIVFGNKKISISDLKRGIYILKINDKKSSFSKKIALIE